MDAANSAAEAPVLDLLGDPIRPIKDPRGRPAYSKSKENQLLVITLRGAGWSQADVAQFMGCDEKTLRKHFSRELDAGALFLDGMAMQVLVKKMLEGHVGAAKEVRSIAQLRAPKTPSDAKPKAPKLGKKEQAQEAAQSPSPAWGDLLNRRPVN